MTFRGDIEDKRVNVLIDTGSFVTLMGKDVADEIGLPLLETGLKEIVGINNISKPVLGTVMFELKVGINILPLKCYVVENIKYNIVLGRDMLNKMMVMMDLSTNKIIFRKNISSEDGEPMGAMHCFVAQDTLLKPNSITMVPIESEGEQGDGYLQGNEELLQKGIIILQDSNVREKHVIVHNIGKDKVTLRRNYKVGSMQSTSLTVDSTFESDKTKTVHRMKLVPKEAPTSIQISQEEFEELVEESDNEALKGLEEVTDEENEEEVHTGRKQVNWVGPKVPMFKFFPFLLALLSLIGPTAATGIAPNLQFAASTLLQFAASALCPTFPLGITGVEAASGLNLSEMFWWYSWKPP